MVRRRLVAGLIDLALTFALFRLVSSIVASTGQFVLMLLYMVGHYVLLPGLHGVSLGKLIMKLRLVNGDGVAPGIIPAIVRTVAFLGDAPLLIGVMLMTGSPGHRRLGDTAAGTYVISAEMVGTPLPVDRFRLAADAPKPTKIEDPAVVARRLAQDKKKQKKKRKDADPYIIPWTPGNTPESAQRAKEADLDALAAAAGNANRQGTKKKAAEIAAPQPSDLPLAHTTWQPSENHEEAEPATGRGARRAAARAEKQALKAAKAETKAAAKAASAVGDITTAGTDESPAMAARPFAPVSHDEAAPPAMDPRWKVGSADANSDRVGDTAPDNEPVAEGDETDPASQAAPSTKRHRLRVPRRNKIKGNTPVPPPPPAEPWSPSAPLAGAAAPSWIPSPASPSKETDTPVVGGDSYRSPLWFMKI